MRTFLSTSKRHWLWVVVAVIAGFGLYVGVYSTSLTLRHDADVLRVLGSVGVVALLVERTIEVTVGAWRGKVTDQLFSAAESAKLALISAPANVTLHDTVAKRQGDLADYRSQTRKVALRAAVLLGLLVAATGFRTIEMLVVPAASTGIASALFRVLDVLMTAAIIGGGSEPIHRLISTVTTYLDSAKRAARVGEVGAIATNPVVPASGVPPVTPGPPKL